MAYVAGKDSEKLPRGWMKKLCISPNGKDDICACGLVLFIYISLHVVFPKALKVRLGEGLLIKRFAIPKVCDS